MHVFKYYLHTFAHVYIYYTTHQHMQKHTYRCVPDSSDVITYLLLLWKWKCIARASKL